LSGLAFTGSSKASWNSLQARKVSPRDPYGETVEEELALIVRRHLERQLAMQNWQSSGSTGAARLLELIQIRLISESLYAVTMLGIPDQLAYGPRSVEELAERSGAHPQALRRVLASLCEFEVFAAKPGDCFALAPLGEHLRRDAELSMRTAAIFFGGAGAASLMGNFLGSVRTGKSATETLFGGWMQWVTSSPDHQALFNELMTEFSAVHLTGLLAAYDFSGISLAIDVGGGHGKVLAEILASCPEMRGILFDLPHAEEGGRRTMQKAGISERCQIISGDFFQTIPAGGDLYILSRVIHDWDNDHSTCILKNVRSGIAARGRLILLETMLCPGSSAFYPYLSDLNMLLRTGGCERTEDEYRFLYSAAGFELTRVIPTGSPTGNTIIEGLPV